MSTILNWVVGTLYSFNNIAFVWFHHFHLLSYHFQYAFFVLQSGNVLYHKLRLTFVQDSTSCLITYAYMQTTAFHKDLRFSKLTN